jgi:hypothetical protein
MDENTQGQAPATDDQELAKVLAGMNEQAQTIAPPASDPAAVAPEAPAVPAPDPMQYEESTLPAPAPDPLAATMPDPLSPPPAVVPTGVATLSPELESLKKDALEELRPLVDKLDLPAEEKFDTLLLIIRSTDDQSLLGAAHTAAKSIENETKRAQALLDVIKEIDFFGAQK